MKIKSILQIIPNNQKKQVNIDYGNYLPINNRSNELEEIEKRSNNTFYKKNLSNIFYEWGKSPVENSQATFNYRYNDNNQISYKRLNTSEDYNRQIYGRSYNFNELNNQRKNGFNFQKLTNNNLNLNQSFNENLQVLNDEKRYRTQNNSLSKSNEKVQMKDLLSYSFFTETNKCNISKSRSNSKRIEVTGKITEKN